MSTLVKKLYLAGPMTGIPKFNFPAFFAAQKTLENLGYEIVSPAEMDLEDVGDMALSSEDGKLNSNGTVETGHTFGDFLARDVKIVADIVAGVVCLPGWEKSKGARLEVFVCLISDKPVYAYTPNRPHGMTPIDFITAADIVKPTQTYNEDYKELAFRKDIANG